MADGAPGPGDDSELRDWAARALRFDERSGTRRADPRADRLLMQWCRHYADADIERFERRLQWDGLDRTEALARLAGPTIEQLPAWADWLQAQFATPWALSPVEAPRHPAEPLWRAWCNRGWQRAGLAADPDFHHAGAPLRDALTAQLAELAGAVLSASARTFAEADSAAGPDTWHDWLATGGLRALLNAHPVLARQLAEASINALAAADELRLRLRADAAARGRCFGPEFARMPESITPTGADRHQCGRQVLRLRFGESDLYYKPRSIAAEALFYRVAEHLAATGVDTAPPTLRWLDCESHGYIAAATPAAVAPDPAGIARWHRRAGGLVALAWLLNARDLHQDNLVATADGPVPVDLETILQPALPDGFGAFDRAQATVAASCLASGLLRFPQTGPDGARSDASGLRGQAMPSRVGWHSLDGLQFDRGVERGSDRLPNRLYAGTDAIDPSEYADAIIDGFRTTLLAVASAAARWLAADGLLQAAGDVAVRVVFRPSQVYADLLQLLATPALQRDGAHSLIAIDRLNRVFAGLAARPAWWALTRAERSQLDRGDLPRFATTAAATGFAGIDGTEAMFERCGLDVVRQRIGSLDAAVIDEQVGLLAAALRPAALPDCEIPPRAEAAGRDDALRCVSGIVDDVLAAAVHGDDGLMTWLQPESLGRAASRGFGGDYYLYHGALGIGWMLAAFDRVQPDRRCTEAVDAVIASVARVAAAPRATEWLAAEPCGAAHGVGSLLLGLLAIARIAARPAALDCALQIAAMLEGDRILAERESDLHSGIAGLLLALAALHARYPLRQHRQLAEQCVARLQALADGDGVPLGYGGVRRSGAAHGLSGIAFALTQAAKAFGRDDWRIGALTLVDVEDRLFDRDRHNWRSGADGDATINSWCNGATGILLLRAAAGLLRGSDAETAALGHLADAPCAAVDHLCCGVLGRAEALAGIGRLSGRPALVATARQIIGAMLARPAARLDRGLDVRRAAGLFRGGSGVALSLLRLQVDPTLPSALLFGLEQPRC